MVVILYDVVNMGPPISDVSDPFIEGNQLTLIIKFIDFLIVSTILLFIVHFYILFY